MQLQDINMNEIVQTKKKVLGEETKVTSISEEKNVP